MARPISSAKGFVHDIETISGLSSDAVHIRFLSDRSLYLLQNLAKADLEFYTRYGEILDGALYDPVDPGSGNAAIVDNAVFNVNEELNLDAATSLDNIADAIVTLAQAQCCDTSSTIVNCGSGGATEEGETPSETVDDGTTSPDPQSWANRSDYELYKCNLANFILDQIIVDINALQSLNWTTITFYGALQLAAVIAATFVTPVIGDEILAVVGTVALVAGAMQPPLLNLEAVFNANRSDLICALFDAPTAEIARNDARNIIATELALVASGLDLAVAQAIGWLFFGFNNLNRLFDFDPDREYPVGSDDCSGCQESLLWQFIPNAEGWFFTDLSQPGSSSVGSHSVPLEAIVTGLTVGGAAFSLAEGRWARSAGLPEVQVGARFGVEIESVSDASLIGIKVRIEYESEDPDEFVTEFTGSGTFEVIGTQTDLIDQLQIDIGRSKGAIPGPVENIDVQIGAAALFFTAV